MQGKRMNWAVLTACIVALSGLARGGAVVMKDGSQVDGKIVEEDENSVKIETKDGVKTFNMAEVREVLDDKEALQKQYRARRARIDKANPKHLVKLGNWCIDNNLIEESVELFEEAVAEDPENEEAVATLRELREAVKAADGGPIEFVSRRGIFRQVDEKLQEGDHEAATQLLEELEEGGKLTLEERCRLYFYYARCHEKAGRWDEALKLWDSLTRQVGTLKEDRAVARARVQLLKECPDGNYKPRGGSNGGLLSDDAVMDQAMKDIAQVIVDEAKASFEEEKRRYASNPSRMASRSSFRKASSLLNDADMLAPGIAKPLLVEIAGTKIGALQQKADGYVEKAFEASPMKLEVPDLKRIPSSRANVWFAKWQRAEKRFQSICDRALSGLNDVREACKEFPADLKVFDSAAALKELGLKEEMARIKAFKNEHKLGSS